MNNETQGGRVRGRSQGRAQHLEKYIHSYSNHKPYQDNDIPEEQSDVGRIGNEWVTAAWKAGGRRRGKGHAGRQADAPRWKKRATRDYETDLTRSENGQNGICGLFWGEGGGRRKEKITSNIGPKAEGGKICVHWWGGGERTCGVGGRYEDGFPSARGGAQRNATHPLALQQIELEQGPEDGHLSLHVISLFRRVAVPRLSACPPPIAS